MELVFEMLNTKQFVPAQLSSKTFGQAGGVIGRGEDCEWVIPDHRRHLSNHHALVSYRDGRFFLTDTSSNGIQDSGSGARLRKGEPQRIEQGSVYVLGDFEIRARLLQAPETFELEAGRPQAAGSIIPDNAFFDLDPLKALQQQEQSGAQLDELSALNLQHQESAPRADYARIDMERLLVPELVAPPEPQAVPEAQEVARQSETFWQRFAAVLGVDLKGLDDDHREALAINAARLLKQSIGGLQQSLRTRRELKNELRLPLTTAQDHSKNPLKLAADAETVLGILLQGNKPGQLPAEQAISRAFRDLQAHQVALLSASRAAVRSTLEHFSPQQLTLRFERDGRQPWLATSGSRWRAYRRYHQTLCQDADWNERLLARDFAQAYEEQVRLISTLHIDDQG
ncbi:type VI secretion system-associated FHA domain protein TagH [Pseudomonas sp. Fl5BN2]|uniref:type VI secretion system-associated FHA domain protein TagH n=1 Tax=Pseudomonas sp. Fl5BN2 TaxID=2697652 RepID=UPI001378C0C6|nr:type VI secretion system-associated FHA domain protein TagH [Pseudomonas sp. Fl5BN2]NBF06184.1 type VI secretion system-associated FHA domain protein TagH [Pseudomonas sp. Fl5BN2]